jgi:hypothetical protein
MLALLWENIGYIYCPMVIFLKKQCNAIFIFKNSFIYVWRGTGKNHPSLSPSVGGQKSQEFNHSWQPCFWHQREHPLTSSVVVLVMPPSFRSGE